jgi:hypothetical protein
MARRMSISRAHSGRLLYTRRSRNFICPRLNVGVGVVWRQGGRWQKSMTFSCATLERADSTSRYKLHIRGVTRNVCTWSRCASSSCLRGGGSRICSTWCRMRRPCASRRAGLQMLTLSLPQRALSLLRLENLHRWEPILYIVVNIIVLLSHLQVKMATQSQLPGARTLRS